MANQGTTALATTNGERGIEQREGFGEKSLARGAETAATAVAAQARAAIEARYVMAMRNPRDMMVVRDRLLKACERPGFARTAIYAKPVGGGQPVRGLSVRFAEEAARCLGNILVEAPVVYDDAEKQLVRVAVTDLEANTVYTEDVVVEKTVERRQLRDGQKPISSRTNSTGQTVYVIAATDDDLLNKRNALKSKAIRNCIIRVLPGDIAEEARETAEATARNQDAKDPDAAKKRLADNFAALSISPAMLAEYLGHPLANATLDEIQRLNEIGAAIANGEATWSDVVARKAGEDEKAATKGKTTELRDALKNKQQQTRGQQRLAADKDDAPEPGSQG